eukprot:15363792-Ditylum_brightwellii.AAC.1
MDYSRQPREDKLQKSIACSCHEHLYESLKQFNVLNNVFHHSKKHHKNAFEDIDVITQPVFDLHGHIYTAVQYDAMHD